MFFIAYGTFFDLLLIKLLIWLGPHFLGLRVGRCRYNYPRQQPSQPPPFSPRPRAREIQWTPDDAVCGRSVSNEVHFFENGQLDSVAHKLRLEGLTEYSLAPSCRSPHVAAFIPSVGVSGRRGGQLPRTSRWGCGCTVLTDAQAGFRKAWAGISVTVQRSSKLVMDVV